MFYLHMAPPVATPPPTSSAASSRLPTPSTGRPKSAAPAICVPTMAPPPTASSIAIVASTAAKGGASHHALATQSPRAAAYVGFSPRVPSAPRPTAATPATTMLGGPFQHVLQAHGSTPSPRRVSFGSTGHDSGCMGQQPSSGGSGTPNDGGATELRTSSATANVYHAMTARKSAEETAKQLARRIAHFRAQEEKVLREVHQMKQRLENLITTHDASEAKTKHSHALKRPMSATTTHASRMAQRSDVKAPKSREQLQFLNKQRRVLQNRNSEAARQQKEKRQAALELQRQKEAAEQSRRAAIKARIQHERQLAIDERAARQQQLLDLLEQQHHARLRQEQAREMQVQQRINDMREEEKNLALRLQALQVHQEHVKRGLEGASRSPSPKRLSPPRPQSARPAPPPTLRTASPRVEPFASAPSQPPSMPS